MGILNILAGKKNLENNFTEKKLLYSLGPGKNV